MKIKKIIPIIVGIIAVVIIVSFVSSYITQKYKEPNSQWIVSGPFAISKPQYKLGENVFMTVNNLKPNEIGNILIVTPQNKTFVMIPFNGTAKDHFNYYFKPDISKSLSISTTEEIIGKWQVMFDLVKYKPLSFEIINETIPGFTPGEETKIENLLKPTLNKTG